MRYTDCIMNRYNSFDVLKAFAAIAVVFIHYYFSGGTIPQEVGMCIRSFCRFAVPVFFCISGFFLTKPGMFEPEAMVRKAKHIGSILIWSSIFYAAFALGWHPLFFKNWSINSFIAQNITADKFVKLFVVNGPFVYAHLWFLLGLLSSYLFCMFIFTKRNYRVLTYTLLPISIIGYYGMQEFHYFRCSMTLTGLEKPFMIYNIFFFRAMPFFLLGIVLRDWENAIRQTKIANLALLFAAFLGCCLAVGERFILRESQFYIGSAITCLSLMCWAIKNPQKGAPLLVHIGRDLSLYIYILHIAVGKTGDLMGKEFHWWGKMPYYILRPFVILLVTILLSEAVFRCVQLIKSFTQRKRA